MNEPNLSEQFLHGTEATITKLAKTLHDMADMIDQLKARVEQLEERLNERTRV